MYCPGLLVCACLGFQIYIYTSSNLNACTPICYTPDLHVYLLYIVCIVCIIYIYDMYIYIYKMNPLVCFSFSGLDVTTSVKSTGWIHPTVPRLQVYWGFGGQATNIRRFSVHVFWVRSSERFSWELDDTGTGKTTLQTRGEKLFEQMRWESFNFAHILGLRCLRASNVPTMRTINNVPTKTLYHKDHQ